MGNGWETAGHDNKLVPGCVSRLEKEVRNIKGIALTLLLAAGSPGVAMAVSPSEGEPAGESRSVSSAVSAEADYRSFSDQELTAQAAQWDALDKHQRRALLTEMKSRMARGGRGGEPVLHIRTERRYGRLIRQPDGRVIRIETNVVRVQPVTPEMLARVRARGGFGVGFERRLGIDRESLEARAAAADGMAPGAASAGAPQGESTAPSLPLLKAADSAP